MKNEIAVKEKTMTTKELAEALGVEVTSIKRTVQKLGAVLHAVKKNSQGGFLFTEEQAILIKQEIQKHHNLATRKIDSVSTEMEMKQKAAEVIQWYMSSYEAEKELRIKAESENKMLKHQVEYNTVIGCSRWKDVKKLLGIKEKWETVCEKLSLEEEVDYFKKCMGFEKFPTVMIPDSTIERIKTELEV